ncbi:magnesium chelatase subunit D [Desulfosarcina sp. BuS5]|uniref:putative cobaltochelatase n=1 Tax=Desulfosarcina sp. BuS5 TaxID=933262 RepID=UPI000483749F|nr:putative cobaltochelatase [Desulfosarcina sp. BuS5]WDN88794.1 magnesium chelatase subunit D [Desulfosarcina sp. BuS5]
MDWTKREIYPFAAIVGQEKMTRALILNAVCPSIGGLLIRGEKGTAKSTAVRGLAAILPEIEIVAGCPFNCDPDKYEYLCAECRKKVKQGINLPVMKKKIKVVDLPLGATEDRVLGSLDFEHAVKKGETFFTPGLLAAAHRGILYIDEVNLLDDHIVDIILDAAGMGMNIVEREGVSCMHRAEFILIGTMNPEEGELRPQLLDRFGMCIQVEGIKDPVERIRLIKQRDRFDKNSSDFIAEYQNSQDRLCQKIIHAGKRFPHVKISEEMVKLCSKLALDAFVAGHRADIIMRKTAITIASCENRKEVTEKEVNEAADLVLLHRVRMPPSPPQHQPEEKKEDPPAPPDEEKEEEKEPEKEEEKPETQNQQKTEEGKKADEGEGEKKDKEKPEKGRPLEMVFPVGEIFKTKRIQMERDRVLRKGSGRRSRTRSSSKAGRYIMSRMQRKTSDLALDATIRAAAPYQKQRRREDVAIAIEESDIREKVREKRIGNFIVFVVDASGSMGAGKRMIETKGAILSLLLDAYQKRDKISMIAFRGDHAEVLLPPTGSVELAHKLLEELPTGGKTPLCHGISLGYQIIQGHFRKDPDTYPLLILISDGKANVSQYGGKPFAEAMEMAEEVKNDTRVNTVVVDVEKPGLISFGLSHQLSVGMGAGYFKIEDLKADTLVEVLRENLLW